MSKDGGTWVERVTPAAEGEPWGEGPLRLGVVEDEAPDGLSFIDVAPVGTMLAPGRVWAMVEGASDVRKQLEAPCYGEVTAVNEDAVREADCSAWLLEVESDGMEDGLL